MKKEWLFIAAVSLTLVGCDRPNNNRPTNSSYLSEDDTNANRNARDSNDTDSNRNARDARGYDADNTGRNVRDSNFDTITSGSQSESEADRTITQNIRREVVATDWISTNGKNVKIVTIEGVVTLRGPVASAKEKDAIEKAAKSARGVRNVNNQLEITQNSNKY
ncbi:MAG: BON domain-containing protein [Parachlamydiaceae bacterium]|nr:BON domain-containing protein [Parachlamydiaceae bacterium]